MVALAPWLEFAFGQAPFAASPTWTVILQRILLDASHSVRIERTRSEEGGIVQPGRMDCILLNDDGVFTPGNTASPYYPNVKRRTRVRVRATWLAVTYTLFDGYVDKWGHSWHGNKRYGRIALSAIDALAFASQRRMRSLYEEEILYDSPSHYWTLEGTEGTPTLESSSKSGADLVEAVKGISDPDNGGGRIDWGAGIGPGTDGLSAPIFVSGTNGRTGDYRYLVGAVGAPDTSAGPPGVSIELTFATRATRAGASCGLVGAQNAITGGAHTGLILDSGTGQLKARWMTRTTAAALVERQITTPQIYWDGRTHHAVFTIVDNFASDTSTGTLYVDGAQRVTQTFTSCTHGPATGARPFEIGRAGGGAPPDEGMRGADATICHVVLYSTALSTADVADHYQAWLNWPNQTTDQRLATLARLWRYPTTSFQVGDSVLTAQATHDKDLADVMKLAAIDSEDGLVFISRDGVLTFQRRWHRYNRSVGFTLTPLETAGDVAFDEDPEAVKNLVTVTRQAPGGSTVTAATVTVKNLASIAANEERTAEIETVLPGHQLAPRGYQLLEKSGVLRTRVEGITVPDVPVALVPTMLQFDYGQAFGFNNLGPNAPATSLEFDSEGVVHEIFSGKWSITIPASPRPPNRWAVVGEGTDSTLSNTLTVGW